MNLIQAKQVMLRTHVSALALHERPLTIELISGPGVGKSDTGDAYAAQLAREINEAVGLLVAMVARFQSVDVQGFMLPQKDPSGSPRPITVWSKPPLMPQRHNIKVFLPDGTVYMPGELPADLPIPRVGIVFLDEWGQGEDDVKKAAADFLLHGQIGTDRLDIGWRVIAASNRIADRSGVLRAMRFITNRRMEIEIEAHLPTWNDWVNTLLPEQRPHHLTVSFANRQPDLVFRSETPAGDGPFCTPRTLVMMDKALRALRSQQDIDDDKLPMDGVAREVCKGLIGGGESAQFFTHLRFGDELPDIADIESAPSMAKLPPKRDGQMVCAFFLASHLTAKNATAIMTYIERMNVDMQVLAMGTIKQQPDRIKLIANHAGFSKWLIRNKDLMMAAYA
jgi:hypothetical protein